MNSVSRDKQQFFPALLETTSLPFLGAIGWSEPLALAALARGASRSLVALERRFSIRI